VGCSPIYAYCQVLKFAKVAKLPSTLRIERGDLEEGDFCCRVSGKSKI
jgi:hypothetical protein